MYRLLLSKNVSSEVNWAGLKLFHSIYIKVWLYSRLSSHKQALSFEYVNAEVFWVVYKISNFLVNLRRYYFISLTNRHEKLSKEKVISQQSKNWNKSTQRMHQNVSMCHWNWISPTCFESSVQHPVVTSCHWNEPLVQHGSPFLSFPSLALWSV